VCRQADWPIQRQEEERSRAQIADRQMQMQMQELAKVLLHPASSSHAWPSLPGAEEKKKNATYLPTFF
jgi:hypothetical protein